MNKKSLILITLIFLFAQSGIAQEVIYDFDGPDTLGTYVDPGGEFTVSYDSTFPGHFGAACLSVQAKIFGEFSWGASGNFTIARNIGDYWDWSAYDTLSVWYYLKEPPVQQTMRFHFLLFDQPDLAKWEAEEEAEHWEYINNSIIKPGGVPGWHEVRIPLIELPGGGEGRSGTEEGLGHPPWEGPTNNGKFDKDKITLVMFSTGFGTQGALDSCWIYLDQMSLRGESDVPIVLFNGAVVPGSVTMGVGWSGSAVVTDEDYFVPPTSIKWTTGSEWDGVNFNLSSPKNLVKKWSKDSLQFKIKAEAGLGDLDLIFVDPDEDGATKDDYAFMAVRRLTEAEMGYDGTWKAIKFALKDFNRFNGVWDGDLGAMVPGEMDSTQVNGFMIAATGMAGFADKVVYLDQMWTGSPDLDITAPDPPNIALITTEQYHNVIYWDDVPGESSEFYDVYYSENPITDLKAPGVEEVRLRVGEELGSAIHWLKSPISDQEVSYHYAITCTDEAGNLSEINKTADPITNTAVGIPTISLAPPQDLVCDGDMSEWQHIDPIIISPLGPGQVCDPMYPVDDESDLYVRAYFAVDDDYFYAAFDVDDDVFAFDPTKGEWINDNVELFIGFHDWRGLKHESFERGDNPDYSIGFYQSNHENHGLRLSTPSYGQISNTDSAYYYFDESATGWIVETRIPWSLFAEAGAADGDKLFQPVNGTRIAFDMTVHDSDEEGVMNGMLGLSEYNFDTSYQNPKDWTHTWIGDKWTPTKVLKAVDTVPFTFSLAQNYPNPFNPETTIDYSLANNAHVQISIFNVLGQRINLLVNEWRSAGPHSIQWDGRDYNGNLVASGIYFYHLKTENVTLQRKLMFMK